MRLHRTRVQRRENPSTSALKGREGKRWFRNSSAGRGMKEEAKWRAYDLQHGCCAKCNQHASLGELKLEKETFEEVRENRLIHRDLKLCHV